MSGMIIHYLMPVVLVLAISGCGRKAEVLETSNPETHAPVGQPISATANSNSQPLLVLPPAADLDTVLAQLTRELRKWIVRHQRPPQSFEEFAASASAQIPAPPAGKKFALSKQMRVIVVNR